VNSKSYLVTGGAGFLGSAVARRLLSEGHSVRILDNEWRGNVRRIADISDDVQFIRADIRDSGAVDKAVADVDRVCHLAYVNGTRFFYSQPGLVLDVAVRGAMNVIDSCSKHGVEELFLASSSEVYQSPPKIPTDETVPLVVPDPLNPRNSYGGGKIINELMALHGCHEHFERVIIFRPHNVYGPDMGWEHVIPQFVIRMKRLLKHVGTIPFPIQGDGSETRAFNFIDDFVEGFTVLLNHGEHRGIYHIGTPEEVAMAEVAHTIAGYFGRDVEIIPGDLQEGSVTRRCPDISKLAALGYSPCVPLREGISLTTKWYDDHAGEAPEGAGEKS
jgi:nucleoside-diphosphate-sugar epimerase